MRKVRANRKCDHSSYLLICLLIRRLIWIVWKTAFF
jgi:hypothetical protein